MPCLLAYFSSFEGLALMGVLGQQSVHDTRAWQLWIHLVQSEVHLVSSVASYYLRPIDVDHSLQVVWRRTKDGRGWSVSVDCIL